jgi:hypothetical protein
MEDRVERRAMVADALPAVVDIRSAEVVVIAAVAAEEVTPAAVTLVVAGGIPVAAIDEFETLQRVDSK